jgi:HEPN domain-containing protein
MSGMSRRHLQALAQEKLDDAMLLLDGKRYASAYYIAGYSVELALKSCIARLFLPEKKMVNDIYTHNIQLLARVAGLKSGLESRRKFEPIFRANWDAVCLWSVDCRYSRTDELGAKAIIEAITDPTDGVLEWIKLHW